MELWFRAERCSISPFQWRPSWVWFNPLLALLKRPSTIFAACTALSQLAKNHLSMPPIGTETKACSSAVSSVYYWLCMWCTLGGMATLGRQMRELLPPSPNPRSNHGRGQKPGMEKDFITALLCLQQQPRARICDGQFIWCNWLKGGECQLSPLLFNLFCFQSEQEVSVLWELVIDVAIVSPAPAETTRRRRSVRGRRSLHRDHLLSCIFLYATAALDQEQNP